MKLRTSEHIFAQEVLEGLFVEEWSSMTDALQGITDDDIIHKFEEGGPSKSISIALNALIRERMPSDVWAQESPIFSDPEYSAGGSGQRWRLDFASAHVAVEVAFNHREALAWNLLKPVLSSELNHVRKAIQTQVGVVILATQALKRAGGFDSAVGTFEDACHYLKPFSTLLRAPILLVGLEAPETFRIEHESEGSKKIGRVRRTQPST